MTNTSSRFLVAGVVDGNMRAGYPSRWQATRPFWRACSMGSSGRALTDFGSLQIFRVVSASGASVELLTSGLEFGGLLPEPLGHHVGAQILGDAHRTELWTAHGAEMGTLGRRRGQGFVVKLAGGFRVEGQVELVFQLEREARPRQGVVALACAWMPLGHIRRVGGDLVGNHSVLDVLAIGQAKVFLGRDVTKHGRSEPADHGRADGRGDVV